MSHRLRWALLPVLCTTATLALTACGPTTGTDSGSGDTASSGSSAGSSATPAADRLLTGTQLKALLLPGSAVPATLKADPSGSRDTGGVLAGPSAAPVSTAKACASLNSSGWISAAGIGGASFAQSDFADAPGNMFAQEIDDFPGSDAKTVMAHLKQVFADCGSFKVEQDGTTYTAKLVHKTLSGLGDEAVQGVVTSSSWDGGETLIAVRVGRHVVTTLYNDQKSTGSADVALTKSLVTRVAAAH